MSIQEKTIDFKHFEKEIYKYCCKFGREVLQAVLESWDEDLASNRDSKEYRHKGKRKTVIKTVMGEVEYSRVIYEVNDEYGVKSYVYLLDEAMGKSGSGFISGLLAEQIVQASCEKSFRDAAQSISSLTGQTISHTAAWNVVQAAGAKLDEQERVATKFAAEGKGAGIQESKVLFEEQDGVWLSLQGKDRKKYGQSREMKLGIAYDGAKKEGKKRYRLTNKVACANFEGASDFYKRKEGAIAAVYNIDEIETRLLCGDGAKWVRQSQTDETVHFQLDQFHRNKAVLKYAADPDARKVIMKLLYEKETELLFAAIKGYAQLSKETKERENYLELLKYFQSNKDGLTPCHRRGLELPEPPEGKEYRRMGTMESNVFTIIGNRMKGRRACWSISGGNNMARILCLKHTGRLTQTLQGLATSILPQRYAEEVTAPLSAAKAPVYDGKGNGSNWLHAGIPLIQTFRTNGREAILGMLRQSPLSGFAKRCGI
jgi:hypothetical protein